MRDANGPKPLGDATVKDRRDVGNKIETGGDGSYRLSLAPGSHEVIASKEGYRTKMVTVQIVEGKEKSQDFDLELIKIERPPSEVEPDIDAVTRYKELKPLVEQAFRDTSALMADVNALEDEEIKQSLQESVSLARGAALEAQMLMSNALKDIRSKKEKEALDRLRQVQPQIDRSTTHTEKVRKQVKSKKPEGGKKAEKIKILDRDSQDSPKGMSKNDSGKGEVGGIPRGNIVAMGNMSGVVAPPAVGGVPTSSGNGGNKKGEEVVSEKTEQKVEVKSGVFEPLTEKEINNHKIFLKNQSGDEKVKYDKVIEESYLKKVRNAKPRTKREIDNHKLCLLRKTINPSLPCDEKLEDIYEAKGVLLEEKENLIEIEVPKGGTAEVSERKEKVKVPEKKAETEEIVVPQMPAGPVPPPNIAPHVNMSIEGTKTNESTQEGTKEKENVDQTYKQYMKERDALFAQVMNPLAAMMNIGDNKKEIFVKNCKPGEKYYKYFSQDPMMLRDNGNFAKKLGLSLKPEKENQEKASQ